MKERNANSLLRLHLPDRDENRHRNDAEHDKPESPFFHEASAQREAHHQDCWQEIAKANLEKFDEAFHASGNAAMQRPYAFASERAKINLQKMPDKVHRYVALDSSRGSADNPTAEQL
jgi:hypothetical protein